MDAKDINNGLPDEVESKCALCSNNNPCSKTFESVLMTGLGPCACGHERDKHARETSQACKATMEELLTAKQTETDFCVICKDNFNERVLVRDHRPNDKFAEDPSVRLFEAYLKHQGSSLVDVAALDDEALDSRLAEAGIINKLKADRVKMILRYCSKKTWVRLVGAYDGEDSTTSIKPYPPSVAELQIAVRKEYIYDALKHVAADTLSIYAPGDYSKRREPLDPDAAVPFLTTCDNPIIVVAPSVSRDSIPERETLEEVLLRCMTGYRVTAVENLCAKLNGAGVHTKELLLSQGRDHLRKVVGNRDGSVLFSALHDPPGGVLDDNVDPSLYAHTIHGTDSLPPLLQRRKKLRDKLQQAKNNSGANACADVGSPAAGANSSGAAAAADERSVDELLAFIHDGEEEQKSQDVGAPVPNRAGGGGGGGGKKTKKKKKRKGTSAAGLGQSPSAVTAPQQEVGVTTRADSHDTLARIMEEARKHAAALAAQKTPASYEQPLDISQQPESQSSQQPVAAEFREQARGLQKQEVRKAEQQQQQQEHEAEEEEEEEEEWEQQATVGLPVEEVDTAEPVPPQIPLSTEPIQEAQHPHEHIALLQRLVGELLHAQQTQDLRIRGLVQAVAAAEERANRAEETQQRLERRLGALESILIMDTTRNYTHIQTQQDT